MGEFYEYNSGYYLPYNSINKTKWYQYGEGWKESNGQLPINKDIAMLIGFKLSDIIKVLYW